jgi:hypothetical protein
MALRQLLTLCIQGRRDEALALLKDHNQQAQGQGQEQGGGLLEQRWEDEDFEVEDKYVWPGDRALHAASMGGSPELVLALLLRGADIHARGCGGMDALMNASWCGQVAAAAVLLDRGADVLAISDQRDAALHCAAYRDKPEMCELLLSRGSDLTAVNDDDQTPLDMYGRNANPRPSPAELASRLARLEAAWRAGPHPSQRWARRWPMMLFVTGCRFRPLAGKQGWVPPTEGLSLEQRERARRRSLVFSSDVLLRLIVSFLLLWAVVGM